MDSIAVLEASNSDLKNLGLQAIGDIISLRSFCERKQRQESGILNNNTPKNIEERKKHLMEILNKGKSTRPVKVKGNDNQILQNTTKKVYFGWIHQEDPKTKPKQVRFKQGGGVREQSLPLTASRFDVLETAKSFFFPGGQSGLGDAKNMQFALTSFDCEEIGDTVKLPSGKDVPFTVQNYTLSGGFSRVKLYLKSVKKHNSRVSENVSSSITEASSSLMGSSQERKVLKEQQDEEFKKGLKADRQKEEIKEQMTKQEDKIKNVKEMCALRIPPEPSKTNHTGFLVRVQHLSEGLVERRFTQDLNMGSVYDWIKAMEHSPLEFTLRNFRNKVIPRKESITVAQKETIYMKESDPLVILDESDTEVSIQDYSLLDVEFVESGPPEKLLEDDSR